MSKWKQWAGGTAQAVLALLMGSCGRPPSEELAHPAPVVKASLASGKVRQPFSAEGFRLPPTVPAAEADLRDGDSVIGVVAGGQARAYSIGVMRLQTRHILNDVVGGVAVTTTFCDRTRCARGFGGQPASSPLDVGQAGLLGGEMVVKVGDVTYLQKTGEVVEAPAGRPASPFPYPEYPLLLTSWGEWRAAHPDTDVYEGDDPTRPRHRN